MEPAQFDQLCILMVQQEIPILDLSREVLHDVERSPGLAEYPQPPEAAILENRKRLGALILERDQQMGLDNPAALARYQAQINAAKKISPQSKAPGGDLWRNRNPGSQVRELLEILETNESINRINLTNLQMGDVYAPKLARFFKNEARTCRADGVFLEVDLTRLKMEEAGRAAIIQSFDNENIFKEINLSSTRLGVHGAECLGRLLSNNPNIESLILTSNHFKAEGLAAIVEGLKQNTKLKSLHIRGNHIGDAGARVLGEYLAQHHTLEALNVENNDILEEGVEALLAGVRQNRSLVDIRVSQNLGLKEESEEAFIQALNHVVEDEVVEAFSAPVSIPSEEKGRMVALSAAVVVPTEEEKEDQKPVVPEAVEPKANLLNDMRAMFMEGFQAMQLQMDAKFEALGHRIHELEAKNQSSRLVFSDLETVYRKQTREKEKSPTTHEFVGAVKP